MPGTARPATGRPFFKQAMNKIRRHMAFNHIALHQRGMTRIELLGYVVFYFDVYELLAADVLLFDFKTIRLQVPDPR